MKIHEGIKHEDKIKIKLTGSDLPDRFGCWSNQRLIGLHEDIYESTTRGKHGKTPLEVAIQCENNYNKAKELHGTEDYWLSPVAAILTAEAREPEKYIEVQIGDILEINGQLWEVGDRKKNKSLWFNLTKWKYVK